MRFAWLVSVVAACAAAPAHSTLPTSAPARDLSSARPATPSPAAERTAIEAKDPRVIDLDIIRIRATPKGPNGEVELDHVATADLFKQATEDAKAGRGDAAIARYREITDDFPESLYAPTSLFDIAAILDGRGDPVATVDALRELVKRYPDSRESIDGHLYIAAIQADHGGWADAVATLDEVLARTNLTYADRIEADARKGYALIELDRYDDADRALQQAVNEWHDAPHLDDPYYIAMAYYYRGELAHRRFLEAPVRLPDDVLIADLDHKRVLAAEAYDRWRDSLDFKQAYWATAAGYQMSQIFVELWQATVKAPYPTRIDAATRRTYVAEVHDRVREHLQKALEGHRMNVELAKAYGVDTRWSQGSEHQAQQIDEMLRRDTIGDYVTPDL